MTDSPDNKNPESLEPVRVSYPPLNLARMRPGQNAILNVTPEFLSPMAHIALLWGRFEDSFQKFLEALMSAKGDPSATWRGLSFEKKAKLFTDEVNQQFQHCPWVFMWLTSIMRAAIPLQHKRNLLLHGSMVMRTEITEQRTAAITLIVTGRRKKQTIVQEFDLEDVEWLAADLASLTGWMEVFEHPNFWDQFLYASWQEIYFLREFLRNNYRFHTSIPIPERPPRASRA
jgi:hypothetical protein